MWYPSGYSLCSEPRPGNGKPVCVCTDCLSLSLCCRLQSSGPSLTTPLPSPSSTCTGKVSVISKVVGQEMGRLLAAESIPQWGKGTCDEDGLASLFHQASSPSEGLLSPKEGVVGRLGLNLEEGLGGSGKGFSHDPSPLPGYLSLSKVVPFSHYAGTLLLLLAGVACLRGRWRGNPVWICPSLGKYSLNTICKYPLVLGPEGE